MHVIRLVAGTDMFVILLVCLGAWVHLGRRYRNRSKIVIVIGVVTVVVTVLTASLGPIIDYPLGSNQALRVYPPTAYPFTMQQYRDYDASSFHYRIVVGWPDGVQIYSHAPTPDQSEFMHIQRFLTTVALGGYVAIGLLLSIPIIIAWEWRSRRDSEDVVVKPSSLIGEYIIRLVVALIVICMGLLMVFAPHLVPIAPGHIVFGIGLTITFTGWVLYVCSALLPEMKHRFKQS